MTDERNYNQNEIDLLKAYYGGSDGDWASYILDPDTDYVKTLSGLSQGERALTNKLGNIYYNYDARYNSDYSQYFADGLLNLNTFNDKYDAREVHVFFHEAAHQAQERAMSDGKYNQHVGSDALPWNSNYNYEEVFDGTPFYKLTAEQQAEFLADRALIKKMNEVGGSIDPTLMSTIMSDMLDKGKDGIVNTHSEADYDSVYNNAMQEGWNALIEKYVAYKDSAYYKVNGDVPGAQARIVGDDSDSTDADTFADDVEEKYGDGEGNGSPLVLDIDGDGIELTNLASANAVYWDIDSAKGDGVAEASGWVTGGDGLLAIDLNEDGIINNSGELFGDQTGYANGFIALAAYDSNQDGFITDEDAVWNDLRIWIEDTLDGISEADELHTLDELSITGIDLGYSNTSSTVAGNDIRQESSFFIDGNTRDIVDVYFSFSDVNTINNAFFEFDYRTLGLPNLRGYGNLPDLYIEISRDNDSGESDSLISLVTDLADTSFANLFDETTTLRDDIVDIMYRWAGVDGVDPTSRGPNIDARQLEFLEKFTGRDFVQTGSANQTDPGMLAAVDLEEAFQIAFNNIYARLVTQAAGGDLFTGDFYYDIASDSFSGITGLDSTALSSLQSEATGLSNTGEREIFWSNVLRVIEFAVGVDNLSGGDQTALGNAIYNSDNTLVMNDLIDGLDYQPTPGSALDGDGSNNTITGGSGNDEIDGAAGDDILSGAAGNDQITGGADDDTITGGTGSDYLIGGTGEDTYNYAPGDGYDVVKEQSTGTGNTNDRIVFGSGIDSGDLTFERAGNSGLRISIDNGVDDPGEIVIENQFNYAAGGGHVEWIDFYADTSIEIATQNFTLTGTAGADTLYGSRYGSAGADTIYGGDGNDTVYGYAPNETSDTEVNTLYGGNGNDKLYAGDGGDTVYGEAGNDTLTGGSGADTLSGGSGDDTYTGNAGNDVFVYTSGNDTITDTSGTNEIHLVAAWDSETPQYFRIGNDLEIFWDASNSITVVNHFTTGEMNQMVYDDTSTVDLTSVSAVTQGTSGNDNLTGTTGDDVLYGFDGDDRLQYSTGSNGNDTLYGGAGDDELYGGYGDDYLDGGAGDDIMRGNNDDDHYFYVSGNDNLAELGGTDILEIASGWEWGNLTFARYSANANDLVIEINGSNSITIEDEFYSSRQIETLRMNDGTGDVDLTSLDYTTYGDGSNNTITGITNANFSSGDVNDTIYGLGGNDTLNGNDGNDTLYGGDGNDTLNGQNDNDTLDGGAGDDTLNGAAGNDTFLFYAGGGLDTITESSGTDVLWITGGLTINDVSVSDVSTYHAKVVVTASTDEVTINNLRHPTANLHVDTLTFDDGFTADLPSYNSWLKGTSGNDMIAGNSSDNVLIGYDGDDDITADSGADHAHGGAGDDTIDGGAGNDQLYGGDDDDTITGGTGDDEIDGGDGIDTVDYSSDGAGVTVDLSAGTAVDGNSDDDTLRSIENVIGSAYADTLTGDSGANVLTGGAGNDDITGGGGSDTLNGGAGNDDLDGGDGVDTADYSTDGAGVTVNLSSGTATDGGSGSDTLTHIENVTGSAYNDTLTGDDNANVLSGGAGADSLTGGAGSDTLKGGDGNDTLNGGDGTDTVDYSDDGAAVTVNLSTGSATDGNSDTDTISYVENARGSDYNDTLTGDSSANFLYGGDGNDTLSGNAGTDYLYGEAGTDTLNGGDDADLLSGGAGNDILNGGNAADTLYGGDDDDTIHGDAGDDTLYGMDGLDTLYGDGGADTFVFTSDTAFNDIDVVKDFDVSTDDDVLDISNILDTYGYEDGVDTLTDWVQITDSGSDSVVKIDITGTATFGAGTQIATLEGITGLTDESALASSGNLLVA